MLTMTTLSIYNSTPEELEGHLWDVVVIGTGAGGATAGFNLARLGKSVVFLERGKLLQHDPTVVRGIPLSRSGHAETALRHGRWPRLIYRKEGDRDIPSQSPVGCGTGGTTSIFGTVMDRFHPEDFTPRQFFPAERNSSVPESWPITYGDLEPFYAQAEKLYRVRGTADPLMPTSGGLFEPQPPSDKESAVLEALVCAGLHPYRLHCASERVPNCTGCPGMLCPYECRNDAGRICLQPALAQYGSAILTECNVLRLEESGRVVRRAICKWRGKRISLRGRIFILAAGAFFSPVILQRSANERFPEGLANRSGLVGRNLMLHASDFMLLQLKRASHGLGSDINHGISMNDFYIRDGTKLGNIHAHPIKMTQLGVMSFLRQYKSWMNRLPAPFVAIIAALGSSVYRSSTVFATIVEDLPYANNRLFAKSGSDEDIVYEYHYPRELRHRAVTLFRTFREAVDSRFTLRLLRPLGMLNMGHVCGTCRFGDRSTTSVLDRNNRAHDLDNLYVVDASFFPSSGGINPSLTIVANSLRVSEMIARRL